MASYTEADRQRLIVLLDDLSTTTFWRIYSERWNEYGRYKESIAEWATGIARMRDHGNTVAEASFREFRAIDERMAENLHALTLEQCDKPHVETMNLVRVVAPQMLHKLPMGSLDVIKSIDPIAAAQACREILSVVLALPMGSGGDKDASVAERNRQWVAGFKKFKASGGKRIPEYAKQVADAETKGDADKMRKLCVLLRRVLSDEQKQRRGKKCETGSVKSVKRPRHTK